MNLSFLVQYDLESPGAFHPGVPIMLPTGDPPALPVGRGPKPAPTGSSLSRALRNNPLTPLFVPMFGGVLGGAAYSFGGLAGVAVAVGTSAALMDVGIISPTFGFSIMGGALWSPTAAYISKLDVPGKLATVYEIGRRLEKAVPLVVDIVTWSPMRSHFFMIFDAFWPMPGHGGWEHELVPLQDTEHPLFW